MRRKRDVGSGSTPDTLTDHIITATFWAAVIGWPVFVLIYRWLN
jgi:hypothetical protein